MFPASCERCKSTDWPFKDNSDLDRGVERCSCRRGEAMKRADSRRPDVRVDGSGRCVVVARPVTDAPGILPEEALAAVEKLGVVMSMVPGGIARRIIAEEVVLFVCAPMSLAWLIKQAPMIYKGVWPGMYELRALYCAKFPPKDGQVAESGVFDTFPFTDGLAPLPQIAAPKRGEAISVASDLIEMVDEVARLHAMPPTPRVLTPPEYLIPSENR